MKKAPNSLGKSSGSSSRFSIPPLDSPARRVSSSIFFSTPSPDDDLVIEFGSEIDIEAQPSGHLDQKLVNPASTASDFGTETELEKFTRYCGFGKGGRKYGKFEISGIFANLSHNRFLKRSGVESTGPNKRISDATASTREAFYVNVDDEAFGTQRDSDVINALPDGAKTTFRVKDIKYGNHNAMWEILSGQLYGLTGLTAPDTRYLVHEDYGNRADGSPKVFVASPTITGYSDLGDFLIDESIKRFIDPESLDIWLKAKEGIEKINKKSKDGLTVSDLDKMERLEHMDHIYQIMPDYFHAEIEKSFAASKFVANWDFANLNLNNIGCRFTLNRQGEVIGFESVFVDFGNSGAIGFKGKYKELSLDHANTEAKSPFESPKDYDPALAFNNEELKLILERVKQIKELEDSSSISSDSDSGWEWNAGWSLEWAKSKVQSLLWPKAAPSNAERLQELNLLQQQLKEVSQEDMAQALNSISSDLADHPKSLAQSQKDLARSIMFKVTHQIRPEEATLGITGATTGFLTVSDLPRNLPFGFLFRSAQRQKTAEASMIDESEPLEFRSAFYRDSEVEMAFRLSLIPDEAIDHVVKKWYLCEEFPTIFPIPKEFKDKPEYTADGVAAIYKQRRDTLVDSIPRVIVDEWAAKNQTQALAAQQEVELALLKKMADPSLIFDRKPGSSDLFAKEVSISHENSFAARSEAIKDISSKIYPTEVIREEIERHKKEVKSKGILEVRALKEELHSTDPKRTLTRNLLRTTIQLKESEMMQKKQEATLDFISSNIEKWKNSLGLRSNPNCSLFNLNRIREIYRIRNNINPTPTDRILNQEECFERNHIIHGENEFTCSRVIQIFNTLSMAKYNPLILTKHKSDPKTIFASASSSRLSTPPSQLYSLV